MLYKSPTLLHVGHHVPCNTWPRCRYARQNSPNAAPLPYSTRDKIRPASPKTPLLECFQRAGRTFSRSRTRQAKQGEVKSCGVV